MLSMENVCRKFDVWFVYFVYELKYHKLIAEFVCSDLCVWISSDALAREFSCIIIYLKENDFEIEIDWLFFEVLLGIILFYQMF